MARAFVLLIANVVIPVFVCGQTISRRVYNAERADKLIAIDGEDTDESWGKAQWQSGFIQHEPYEGREPTRETSFKIMYDDNNLYVLIRCWDDPDSIQRRLTRRDDQDGDLVGIQIDSYNDKRTAFTFIISAAGVKTDFLLSEDGQSEDLTWDPIWYAATTIDKDGWLAEMRIPLSQLRFGRDNEQHWGLQLRRYLYRRQELSLWQHIPKDAPGWVHLFGELQGVRGIKPKRQIEIAPYAVASAERYQAEEGNPFQKGEGANINGGVDGKIGITNNMIMDFTINPDFGQVEADPSEVNLTAFETYYTEKRPFFIEGKNIFNFPISGIGSSDENLFYSRRIGRVPERDIDLAGNTYADVPSYTKILGASKITGKTPQGLSLGILESVTRQEDATIDSAGIRHNEPVEPLSNYFVTRVQQDLQQGSTILGGIFTAVNRGIHSTLLNFLPTSAYTGGADFTKYWREKKYHFTGKFLFSSVRGNKNALLKIQTSSAHYFQRPDMDYVRFDSSRTSLSGHAGFVEVGKDGGGHWRWTGSVTWKSPGFETNDIGYIQTTDEIYQSMWLAYRIWEPFSIFRWLNLNLNQWSQFNFGLINTLNGYNINTKTQFKNYWDLSLGVTVQGMDKSPYMLRGGSSFKIPSTSYIFLYLNTDERKKLSFELDGTNRIGAFHWLRQTDLTFTINYRPVKMIQVSFVPGYNYTNKELQYVSQFDSPFGKRYIFADIHQQILSMSVRLNLSLTPNMTLQYWGQPFIAAGKYSRYKYITNPCAESYYDRYHLLTSDEIQFDPGEALWKVDEDHDALTDYSFGNPDFNVREYKSNLVFRWEYVPGCTLYLVWSQTRDDSVENGVLKPADDFHDLFSVVPHNVWLIKLSYRFRQ